MWLKTMGRVEVELFLENCFTGCMPVMLEGIQMGQAIAL